MTRWTNPGILALFTVLALGACKKKTEEEMPNPAPKVETPATPEPAKVAATAPTKAPTAAPEKPAEPEPTEPAAPPPPVHTAAVCAGGGHTCYLKASGEVLCVGDNIDGQLGDGTAMNRSMPSPVADLSGVMEIACNLSHLRAPRDGTVMCWGQSWHGELGYGAKDPTQTPVAVKDLTGAKQLTLGYGFLR